MSGSLDKENSSVVGALRVLCKYVDTHVSNLKTPQICDFDDAVETLAAHIETFITLAQSPNTCKSEACNVQWIVQHASPYCPEHQCIWSGDFNCKEIGKDQLCDCHRCLICQNQVRGPKYKYCTDCAVICEYMGCYMEVIGGKYCDGHICRKKGCRDITTWPHAKRCKKHYDICVKKDCIRYVYSGSSDLCFDHDEL